MKEVKVLKISEEIIRQIKERLDKEYKMIEEKWIDKVIEIDTLHEYLDEYVYDKYIQIPLEILTPIIEKEFPFTKNLVIYPYTRTEKERCNISGSGYEIKAELHIRDIEVDRSINDKDREQVIEICDKIMEIYDILNLNMTIYLERHYEEAQEENDEEDYSSVSVRQYKIVGL